jgi:hypothetical protein
MSPVHPGEILLEDFMKPLGLSDFYELELPRRSGSFRNRTPCSSLG